MRKQILLPDYRGHGPPSTGPELFCALGDHVNLNREVFVKEKADSRETLWTNCHGVRRAKSLFGNFNPKRSKVAYSRIGKVYAN